VKRRPSGSAESAPRRHEIKNASCSRGRAGATAWSGPERAGVRRGDPRRQVEGARERALFAFKKGHPGAGSTTSRRGSTSSTSPTWSLRPAERAGGVRPPDRPHGRAGASVPHLLLRFEERPLLADIERLMSKHLTVVTDHLRFPAKPAHRRVSTRDGRLRNHAVHDPVTPRSSRGRSASPSPPSRFPATPERGAPTSGPGGRRAGIGISPLHGAAPKVAASSQTRSDDPRTRFVYHLSNANGAGPLQES